MTAANTLSVDHSAMYSNNGMAPFMMTSINAAMRAGHTNPYHQLVQQPTPVAHYSHTGQPMNGGSLQRMSMNGGFGPLGMVQPAMAHHLATMMTPHQYPMQMPLTGTPVWSAFPSLQASPISTPAPSSPSTPTHVADGSKSVGDNWQERVNAQLKAHAMAQHHDEFPVFDSHNTSDESLVRSVPQSVRTINSANKSGGGNRKRASSHTSNVAHSALPVSDDTDRIMESLLLSIQQSVAKVDALMSHSNTNSLTHIHSLTDVKSLLQNACDKVSLSSKKRKSIDESMTETNDSHNVSHNVSHSGTTSPYKRRSVISMRDDEQHSQISDASMKRDTATVAGSVSDSANDFENDDDNDSDSNNDANNVEMDDDEDADAAAGRDNRGGCKPCPLLESVPKKPIKVLYVNVQAQYTVAKKETQKMSREEKERLVPVHVRIMGNQTRDEIYFVAKDVCLLIHTRKGNVAKSIGQFKEGEKVRMSVVCPRSNGTVSTHILTALTLKGVKRLLSTSRSPLAPHVLKWIQRQIDIIQQEWADAKRAKLLSKDDKSTTEETRSATNDSEQQQQTASDDLSDGRAQQPSSASMDDMHAKLVNLATNDHKNTQHSQSTVSRPSPLYADDSKHRGSVADTQAVADRQSPKMLSLLEAINVQRLPAM